MAVRRHAARLSEPGHGEDRAARRSGTGAAAALRAARRELRLERLHHFCLAVDDLDAVVAELAERGVPLLGEPFVVEEIDRRLAFLEDNSGNLIELSAANSLSTSRAISTGPSARSPASTTSNVSPGVSTNTSSGGGWRSSTVQGAGATPSPALTMPSIVSMLLACAATVGVNPWRAHRAAKKRAW